MKTYDYDLAKKIITTYNDLGLLESASLGMREDWAWTADTIWNNGEWLKEIPDNYRELYEEYKQKRKEGMSILSPEYDAFSPILIGGIMTSGWATPAIELLLITGETLMFACYEGSDETDYLKTAQRSFESTQGCISQPVQERVDNLELQVFKQDTDND